MIDDSRREDFIGIADDLQGVWVVSVVELAFQDICNLGCDTQYHGPLGWGGCPNGRLDCWILFETLPGPVQVRQAMEQNIAASHRLPTLWGMLHPGSTGHDSDRVEYLQVTLPKPLCHPELRPHGAVWGNGVTSVKGDS